MRTRRPSSTLFLRSVSRPPGIFEDIAGEQRVMSLPVVEQLVNDGVNCLWALPDHVDVAELEGLRFGRSRAPRGSSQRAQGPVRTCCVSSRQSSYWTHS